MSSYWDNFHYITWFLKIYIYTFNFQAVLAHLQAFYSFFIWND